MICDRLSAEASGESVTITAARPPAPPRQAPRQPQRSQLSRVPGPGCDSGSGRARRVPSSYISPRPRAAAYPAEAAMITWLTAELLQLGGRLTGLGHVAIRPRDLLAVTATPLVGLAIALRASGVAAAVTAGPPAGRVVALREKSWSAAFQRQRDPDAAGRPRPRAPGMAPAAA